MTQAAATNCKIADLGKLPDGEHVNLCVTKGKLKALVIKKAGDKTTWKIEDCEIDNGKSKSR